MDEESPSRPRAGSAGNAAGGSEEPGRPLVDYLAIIGLNPNEDFATDHLIEPNAMDRSPLRRPYMAYPLCHYPEEARAWPPGGDAIDWQAVVMFCFPRGLRFQTKEGELCWPLIRFSGDITRSIFRPFDPTFGRQDDLSGQRHTCTPHPPPRASMNCQTQLFLGSGSPFPVHLICAVWAGDRRVRFHTFVLTQADGTRVYGANLIFHERVEDEGLLLAMNMLQLMYEKQKACDANQPAFLAASSSGTATPASTPVRSASPGTAMLDLQHGRDALYAPKSLCLLSRVPVVACLEEYLRQLYTVSQQEDCGAWERHAAYLLHQVPLPPAGATLQFACTRPILCHRPPAKSLPLFEYSMRRLTLIFSPRHILQLFACALLEEQIVLRSADYEQMVMVAECITALMYPFAWHHVYVPILPTTLLQYVEAPMPYIMGLHADLAVAPPPGVCVVDLDRGSVALPDDVPEFPEAAPLEALLEALNKERAASASAYAKLLVAGGARGLHGLLAGKTLPPTASNPGTAEDYRLTARVREAFLHSWVRVMAGYEAYLIDPSDGAASPGSPGGPASPVDTDSVFDRMSFLSDQPKESLPFLSKFAETQAFSQFIDAKVSATIAAARGEAAPASLFDTLLKGHEARAGAPAERELPLVSPDGVLVADQGRAAAAAEEPLSGLSSLVAPQREGASDAAPAVDFVAAPPSMSPPRRRKGSAGRRSSLRALPKTPATGSQPRRRSSLATAAPTGGSASPRSPSMAPPSPPQIGATPTAARDAKTLPQPPPSLGTRRLELPAPEVMNSCPVVSWPEPKTSTVVLSAKRSARLKRVVAHLNSSGASANRLLSAARDRRHKNSSIHLMGGESDQQSHAKFADALLAESASKIKKIVLVMMGTASAAQPGQHNAVSRSTDYENTMVTSLCGLLERMWRHGCRAEGASSALWSFLEVAVARSELDHSVAEDIRRVGAMPFLRTDIGRGRAWLRLVIEKKTLSRDLEALLGDLPVASELYKNYAFLRQDEHRQQLLSHLLSLTTVDFSCFSANYAPAPVTYEISVHTAKGFRAGTSANVEITLAGDHGSLGPMHRPKGQSFAGGAVHTFQVEHSNLGPLQSVTLGHDSSGMSAAWQVHHVEVRSLLTGRSYHFPCGRRIAKDGERGCQVELPVQLPALRASPVGDPSSPIASPDEAGLEADAAVVLDEATNAHHDELAERFVSSVNSIVRYCYQPDEAKGVQQEAILLLGTNRLASRSRERLLPAGFSASSDAAVAAAQQQLLGGQGGKSEEEEEGSRRQEGLCGRLLELLSHGFKARTMFGGPRHVWDFIERCQQQLRRAGPTAPENLFCELVDQANALGCHKTGRFEWLVCAGAARQVLHFWVDTVSLRRNPPFFLLPPMNPLLWLPLGMPAEGTTRRA